MAKDKDKDEATGLGNLPIDLVHDELPEVTTECYQVQKDSVVMTLSNGCVTHLTDISMTDLVKQWETQNTYPGGFFVFYKAMQLRMTTNKSIAPTEVWTKGCLVTRCRNAIDDFIKTGEDRFLTDAANCLAILYSKKQITQNP